MSEDVSVGDVFQRLVEELGDDERRDKFLHASTLIRGDLFLQQLWLVEDPSKYKVGLCSRRAGKSTAAVSAVHDVMCRKPGANVLYVHLTRVKGKEEIWPALKRHALKYDLCDEGGFNESMLTIQYNGGTCILKGADNLADVGKLRGSDGGYDLIVIDEGGVHHPEVLKYMIRDVLSKTLGDRPGSQMIVIGTPGRELLGDFYDATGPKADEVFTDEQARKRCAAVPYARREEAYYAGVTAKWSQHKWQTEDNTAAPWIWQEFLREKDADNIADDDPIWRREHRAEWVLDGEGFVSAFDRAKNTWDGPLPLEHKWTYALGVDPGVKDPTAFVVAAWSETSNDYHFVDELELTGMDVTDVAAAVRAFEARYGPFDDIVGDSAALIYWTELARRHGITVRSSVKLDSDGGVRAHVELMNSDFRSGRCWVKKGLKLADQIGQLKWKLNRKQIDDSTPDHLFDAARYIWRYLYTAFPKRQLAATRSQLASPAAVHARIQRDIAEQIDEANADRDRPMYDRDLGATLYDD